MANTELSKDVIEAKSPLLQERHVYKPFLYPWCYEAWLTQQRVHWLPEEVPMAEDIRDWKKKLTPAEINLLTQIFRFFTQADVEVNNCYMKHYAQVFGPVEVQMMLSAFSNIETVHIAAYSHLLDTLGMPESEYEAFLKYKAMKDKFDILQNANMNSRRDIAKTMAMFGAFTEGLALFASFAILMNFPRFNKMKGMGQIITWSVRDETLHCLSPPYHWAHQGLRCASLPSDASLCGDCTVCNKSASHRIGPESAPDAKRLDIADTLIHTHTHTRPDTPARTHLLRHTLAVFLHLSCLLDPRKVVFPSTSQE